jgi:hypothetical protein
MESIEVAHRLCSVMASGSDHSRLALQKENNDIHGNTRN